VIRACTARLHSRVGVQATNDRRIILMIKNTIYRRRIRQ
jgi:hypothetical protein